PRAAIPSPRRRRNMPATSTARRPSGARWCASSILRWSNALDPELRDHLGLRIGAEAGALRHRNRAVDDRHGLGIGGEGDVAEQPLERGRALLGGERMQGREVARPEEEGMRHAGNARLLGLARDLPKVGEAADLDDAGLYEI